MSIAFTPAPAADLLTPDNHVLMLIDHQSQMAFPVRSQDVAVLRLNTGLVSEAAAGFGVSTVLTSVAAKGFSGPFFDEVLDAFPGTEIIDRTTMNAWEDATVIDRVNALGKQRIVIGGLWTSVCIVGPVLSALEQGAEVYVITDICGDVSSEAHERAVERMIQRGARPMTALQYLLELQRDWARGETYGLTTGIARKYAGGYGIGIVYAKAMFGAQEGGHAEAA
ncbi:MAG: isochorismatase family protein [Sphingomonas sp.]|uniref:isochorismatase family protein n=1 Tax=Sphingomonas sp. TaxID=28214 RepID=UPI001B071E36|nr:isochorismatase family protein [Sphingomonas sp.]MBO9623364.1 isochorismatase family protein [Sphingomonas sp.]